jgi:DNA polymerase-1
VLAHLSRSGLVDAFREGRLHDRTSARFSAPQRARPHSCAASPRWSTTRSYGKGAFTLAKDIGVTAGGAEFIDDTSPASARAFIDRTLEEARVSGVVKTMFGRRRLMPELNSRDFQRRAAAEREAVNMPIQGSAADIMKRAMIEVHAALASQPDARMILTVHDELLFEVPKARAEEVAEVVRERMQAAAVLNVPLTVDVGIGENWKDAKS